METPVTVGQSSLGRWIVVQGIRVRGWTKTGLTFRHDRDAQIRDVGHGRRIYALGHVLWTVL